MRFFFFGLLSDREMLDLVAGRTVPGHPFPAARLPGHRLVRMRNETFPMLVSASGSHVTGVVVEGLGEADLDRIMFFESVEYEPKAVVVETAGGALEALAFATTARAVPDHEPWTFEDWARRFKAHDLHEARLWMSLHGVVDAAEAGRLWDEARASRRPLEDMIAEVCGAKSRPVTLES